MTSLSTTPSTIVAATSPGVAITSIVSTISGADSVHGFALPAGQPGSPGGAQCGGVSGYPIFTIENGVTNPGWEGWVTAPTQFSIFNQSQEPCPIFGGNGMTCPVASVPANSWGDFSCVSAGSYQVSFRQ
jgi:hypothetical protein